MTATSPRVPSPTLDAVAELAGVSRATVSRVVNDSPRVSPEAREAVQAAVAQLRYVPNRMARSLVTRRTGSVALVLSERETSVFSDPFVASTVRGLSGALAEADTTLLLLTARDAREQERVGRYVRQGHVDGVVLMSLSGEDRLPELLAATGLPLVSCGRPVDGRPVAYVDADNVGGARAATEHLLATGRRRIGTVTGPQDMAAGQDRLTGWRTALAAAGRPHGPELAVEGDFTEAGGARATQELLARAPDLDAVFVASDPMAVGALRVLRAAGRRVPADVAVIGFDDATVAQACDPPLTTVAQPLEEMTRALTELLLAQVEDGVPGVESRICATHLVRRVSA